jgi:hypothetical protein
MTRPKPHVFYIFQCWFRTKWDGRLEACGPTLRAAEWLPVPPLNTDVIVGVLKGMTVSPLRLAKRP